MCQISVCPFEESVTSKDMLRTSRVPAPSVCAKILVAVARRIMLKAHRAAKTCQRGPKGPGLQSVRKCAHGKNQNCGVFCNESRSLVYMTVGTWCLPMSMVTCSRKCIVSIWPCVLVKLSCMLCRLVPFLFCSVQRLQKLRSRARLASGSMDWMQPFCFANMFQLVSYRLPCTCSTDTFFTNHYSRTCGAVPNMLESASTLKFSNPVEMCDDSTGDSSKIVS